MSAPRTCPLCRHEMEARHQFGMEIDICTVCGGVFLDPGESEAQGVDTGALFGDGRGAATALMTTERLCPSHREPMTRYRVVGVRRTVEVERADCCGGIFLDPGEQSELAQAAAHAWRLSAEGPPRRRGASEGGAAEGQAAEGDAAAVPREAAEEHVTASGAVFAMPPGRAMSALLRGAAASTGEVPEQVRSLAPDQVVERHCPRCEARYHADRTDDIEVDVCRGCGSMFFDPGEIEARGVDTAALFGVGPEAATEVGPSPLSCPACQQPMQAVRVETLAGTLEVDRAPCCGGLFLDGGEHEPFTRAARAATYAAADRTFERHGSVAGEAAVRQAIDTGQKRARRTGRMRGRVDSMLQRLLRRS